jgi:hypothetical protein
VWEYWIEDPMKKVILVYDMEHDATPAIHSLGDTVKVNIYDDLEIDFSKLQFLFAVMGIFFWRRRHWKPELLLPIQLIR